jgi:Asp-tRNA(Asn)/Glu-tRNA(Gln) amidotransferase A subunit family amidase
MYSHTLDTIGWYGRCVDDLILVARAFRLAGIETAAPVELRGLRVGLCESPMWEHAEPEMRAALHDAGRRLEQAGAIVTLTELPAEFGGMAPAQDTVMHGEGRAAFLPDYLGAHHLLAQDFRDRVENERGITPAQLLEAYALADRLRPVFDGLFGADLDVLLTPASTGEAPVGLYNTGNHVFNKIWTLLHVPCVAIPAGRGPTGLPVGLQVVGPRFGDAALLAAAKAMAPAIDIVPLTPVVA